MLSGLLIISVSACGKQSGLEQSQQSKNTESIEQTAISQTEETTKPATDAIPAQGQEDHAMSNDISTLKQKQ